MLNIYIYIFGLIGNEKSFIATRVYDTKIFGYIYNTSIMSKQVRYDLHYRINYRN